MSANYEKEQKELLAAVEHDEQAVRKAEQEKIDLKVFLEAIRECTDLKELTPTIVNTLIKRIEVHNSEKGEDGLKHVPIDISFTAVEMEDDIRMRDQLSYQEKNRQLYIRQKEMLALFLQKRAISQEQYEKSLHDLTEEMGYKEE